MAAKKNLTKLEREIAALDQRRERLLAEQRAGLLRLLETTLEQALQAGFSARELTALVTSVAQTMLATDTAGSRRGRRRLPITKARKMSQPQRSAPPKYLGPGGEAWSGRGPRPRWFTALSPAEQAAAEQRAADAARAGGRA